MLQNYFIPSFKLLEKKRINSKYYKTYDTPKTAFEKVVGSKHVSKQSKDSLKKQYQSLDPFKLKLQINRQLKEIFRLVTVTSNVRKRI